VVESAKPEDPQKAKKEANNLALDSPFPVKNRNKNKQTKRAKQHKKTKKNKQTKKKNGKGKAKKKKWSLLKWILEAKRRFTKLFVSTTETIASYGFRTSGES
jgi:hypothetical protein